MITDKLIANFDQYDVVVTAGHSETRLDIAITFSSDFMTHEQGRNLTQCLGDVIKAIVTHAALRLNEIDMMPESEKAKIWKLNQHVPEPLDECVHRLIEIQVKSRPHSVAVDACDGTITYGELDGFANQLAHTLHNAGIKTGSIVPVCFERSKWTTVAVVAVLKTGAAFVMIEPTQPHGRLASIMEQTSAKLILASKEQYELSHSLCDNVVTVDENIFTLDPSFEHNTLPYPDPSASAYMVFTSGSTGTPKGVMVSHRALSTNIRYQAEDLGFGQSSRVLNFAANPFDIFVYETTVTLSTGGCLCVPSDEDRKNDLAQYINKAEVSVAVLTPTVAGLLEPSSVPSLRALTLVGEAMNKSHAEKWCKALKLINAYGPSECTPNSIVNSTATTANDALRIGTGAGVATWIVDPRDHKKLTPFGAVGEILLEGPLLGNGYLNDPEKTNAAFIRDPIWLTTGTTTEPGRQGLVYKTGDLARYNQDGSLSYMGRKDTQVKIRGQRVELGEVERHVANHVPQAKEAEHLAAEVVQPSGAAGNALLAVFFSSTKAKESVAVVTIPAHAEDAIAAQVPSYMVPSVYFEMSRLPMTVTGKIDRKRLRELAASFSTQQLTDLMTQSSGVKLMPSTDMERQLQLLWSHVLNLEPTQIGAHDSFFRLGGDSIGAMRLVAQGRLSSLHFTVADVFQKPRLSALAQVAQVKDLIDLDLVAPFSLLKDINDTSSILASLSGLCRISPDMIEDVYPSTPLQQGLLAMASKSPGSYTLRAVLELSPAVDIIRFRDVWERAVRKIPILRTRIVEYGNLGLLQAVVKDDEIDWIEAESLEAYLAEDAKKAMILGYPLARYALVGKGKKYFVWTLHHALYDGGSLPLMLELVEKLYSGGDDETNAAKTVDIRPFVKHLTSDDNTQASEYWRFQFSQNESAIYPNLPATCVEPRPSSVMKRSYALHPTLRYSDHTLATLVRASWAIVSASRAGSNDVTFGAVVSGRQAPINGVDSMIFPTIATVPVRIQVPRANGVKQFLDEVQNQATVMIPFEQTGLQKISKMGADAERACGFQTLLVVQPASELDQKSPFGQWQEIQQPNAFSNYALAIEITPKHDEIEMLAMFDEKVLSNWETDNVLDQFSNTLNELIEAGQQTTVQELSTLAPRDLEMLWRWNEHVPVASEICIHQMIEQNARLHPTSLAVTAWDGEFSYGQVEELANKLAGKLTGSGIGSGDIVPLCFERTKWTTVAILAVLKAGAAFVMLEPSHPVARLTSIIDQISAKVILTSHHHLHLASALCENAITVGPEVSGLNHCMHGADRLPYPSPSSPAYVAFTSGSTGTPKGAIVSHRAISSAIHHQSGLLGIQMRSRIFNFSANSFDVFIYETMMALTNGACLCVPSDTDRKDRLESSMRELAASILITTPSVTKLLTPAEVPALEMIWVGGEPITLTEAGRWRNHARVLNCFGPAECCPVSILNHTAQDLSTVTRIGKGAGVVTWVVDATDHNRLVPIGTVGELLLEGPLLGNGYLNNPEQTSSVFVEDPDWLVQGTSGWAGRRARLYKTGDLVRYNDDGSLSYVGRKDTQVKVRGQRVELEEVERHARACVPQAKDGAKLVAEVVTPSGHGAAALLAVFLSVDRPTSADASVQILTMPTQVEDELSDRLPSYMVPSVFIGVPELPLTTNGKTDRKRLREIVAGYTAQQLVEMSSQLSSKRQPSTETERSLQLLWSRVLNIELGSIGVDDTFTRLGGDSITAMQISSAARSMGLSISTADVLQKKTISKVARTALLTTQAVASQWTDDLDTPFGLSPIQKLYMQSAEHPTANFDQSFLLKLSETVDHQLAKEAFETLVSRHSMLRANFSRTADGSWQQSIKSVSNSSLSMTFMKTDDPDDIAGIVASARAKLDIQHGPLMAAALIDQGNSSQLLFISIHHLVIDLVSWRVLLQDLEALLRSQALSPAPAMSFQSWYAAQAEYVGKLPNTSASASPTTALKPDLEYWGDVKTGKHITDSFVLDQGSTSALLGDCNEALRTRPQEIMIAALIHSFTLTFPDRTSPAIFTETHGRETWDNSIDISQTVGWFTSMYPIQVSDEASPSFLHSLQETKDCARSFPYNGWLYFASLLQYNNITESHGNNL